jgi:hypothetical protein
MINKMTSISTRTVTKMTKMPQRLGGVNALESQSGKTPPRNRRV